MSVVRRTASRLHASPPPRQHCARRREPKNVRSPINSRGDHPMKLSDFKYPLPRNLVAKHPAKPRDSSRMMVLNRALDTIEEKRFSDLPDYFRKGDCLIVNQTKVFPARLFGKKEKTNAKIEVFLLRELNQEEGIWDVIVDPARKV